MRTERSIRLIGMERMTIPCNASILRRGLPFCDGIHQFQTTTQEQPKSTFAPRNRQIQRVRIKLKKMKENRREQHSYRTRDQYFIASYPFTHQDIFSSVANSCLTVISERSSYQLDRKFRSSWDFFDLGKRLLEGSRVESRFRGTRTMPFTPVSCGTGHSSRGTRTLPYAYWGGECQSERAIAWRENAFFNCVLVRTERDTVGLARWSERMKKVGEAEDRPKGAVERWKRDRDAQINRKTSVESE